MLKEICDMMSFTEWTEKPYLLYSDLQAVDSMRNGEAFLRRFFCVPAADALGLLVPLFTDQQRTTTPGRHLWRGAVRSGP